MRRDPAVSFDPLLQSSFQVIVGLAAQAWKSSNTLSLRAMAKLASRNIVIGYAMSEDLLAFGGERLVTIAPGLSRHRRDISCHLAIVLRQHADRNMRHIFQRKWAVPLFISETLQLIDNVFLVLAREPRGNGQALQGGAMTKGAVSHDVGRRIDGPFSTWIRPAIPVAFLCMARKSEERRGSHRQRRYCGFEELHGLGFRTYASDQGEGL